MQYVEFVVVGDPQRAKATVSAALQERKFTLTWTDEWTGVAERGSKVANVLGGVFAQYFKVGLQVMSGGGSQSIVRLDRLSSGWMGGALGASRTNRNFVGLRDELRKTFDGAGVLVEDRET